MSASVWKYYKVNNKQPNFSNSQKRSAKFLFDGEFAILAAAELNYECSGTCKPPLFSITRPISEGMPQTECLSMILPGLKKQLQIIGFTTLTFSIVALFSFFVSIPLFTPLRLDYISKKREKSEFEL